MSDVCELLQPCYAIGVCYSFVPLPCQVLRTATTVLRYRSVIRSCHLSVRSCELLQPRYAIGVLFFRAANCVANRVVNCYNRALFFHAFFRAVCYSFVSLECQVLRTATTALRYQSLLFFRVT